MKSKSSNPQEKDQILSYLKIFERIQIITLELFNLEYLKHGVFVSIKMYGEPILKIEKFYGKTDNSIAFVYKKEVRGQLLFLSENLLDKFSGSSVRYNCIIVGVEGLPETKYNKAIALLCAIHYHLIRDNQYSTIDPNLHEIVMDSIDAVGGLYDIDLDILRSITNRFYVKTEDKRTGEVSC